MVFGSHILDISTSFFFISPVVGDSSSDSGWSWTLLKAVFIHSFENLHLMFLCFSPLWLMIIFLLSNMSMMNQFVAHSRCWQENANVFKAALWSPQN